MLSTEDIIFMIIVTGEFIIGVLGNGFIGLVTWIDWVKKKKLSSIDYILTSLAISRIFLICVIVSNTLVMILQPNLIQNDKLRIVVDIFWTLSNHSSNWFGTCLCVFYLLKIANFSHPFFLWLKWRIDRVIAHILLGCLTISLLIFLTLVMILSCDYEFYMITKQNSNFTDLFSVSKLKLLTVFALLGIGPFTLSLISLFLLIISLWRHTKQMKHNATGHKDASIEAHAGAMKTVTSFLFLLFVYHLAFFSSAFSYYMTEKKLTLLFAETLEILYPSGHSLILILGYNKLRQAFLRMQICGKQPA